MIQMIKRLVSVNGNNINQAKQELKWLTQHVLQQTRKPLSEISLIEKINLNVFEKRLLNELINERVEKSKPLQYILGTQPFCDLEIITKPPVLIPRWETEEWTSKIISMLIPFLRQRKEMTKFEILDICTGSGCIALSLSHHLPTNSSNIHGIDISPNALSLAKLNHHIFNSKNRLKNSVKFSKLDILKATRDELDLFIKNSTEIGKGFDLILSNPPYVTHEEYKTLQDDVKLWEDKIALVAEEGGTAFHKRIAHLAKDKGLLYDTKSDLPQLIMEIGGSHQVSDVVNNLKNCGFSHVEIWKDVANKDRCVVAKRT
ncbi:12202_t:CDS:1 [Funneliformis mosseae]|uniref:12202_t:CDS:1 n=1 Tax=Funneliformis mosseae TaxID=27381 RepID=A0A9N9B1G4_FUNMO|nr:12202_t:CDS:1 [Funneliformis mosseae]